MKKLTTTQEKKLNFKKGELMKVFVYRKRTSNCIAVYTGITTIIEHEKTIQFFNTDGKVFSHDKKKVKTKIYQN